MIKSKASTDTKQSESMQSMGSGAGGRGREQGSGKSTQTKNGGQKRDKQNTNTGAADEHYNLVSVLYHSLKGAQLYSQYIRDAEDAGDSELSEFFEDVHEAERLRADKARELLTRRLGRSGTHEMDESE